MAVFPFSSGFCSLDSEKLRGVAIPLRAATSNLPEMPMESLRKKRMLDKRKW